MTHRTLTVAAAVAAALGLGSAVQAQTVINQAGSSAVAPFIEQIFGDNCGGTAKEYRDTTDATGATWNGGGKSVRAYTCTFASNANTTAGGIAGLSVIYYERLDGGSIYGINPVAQGTALGAKFDSLASCTAVTPTTAPPAGISAFSCPAATAATSGVVPDFGISDVEPALFFGTNPNLPSGFTALNTTDQKKLTATPWIQQTFAVAVSTAGASAAVTNLTTTQVQSILAGFLTDWGSVGGTAGSPIQICARKPGSGTQASANAFFLQNPCSANGQLPFASANVYLGSSTGDVLTCLQGTNAAVAQKNGTLGMVGVADPKSTDTALKFVTIDDAAATAANAATGAYRYAVESTINSKTAGYTDANVAKFVSAMTGALASPGSIINANSGFAKGAALNALGVNYPSSQHAPYQAANPVTWGTKSGSTCAPYADFFPAN